MRTAFAHRKLEKFIGADQMLIEFEDDKELQAALEAAKKEAEAELETITYNGKKAVLQKEASAIAEVAISQTVESAVPGVDHFHIVDR